MSKLTITARAIGLDTALVRLRGFPNKIRRDALRPAFRAIGSILSRDVKKQLPGKKQGSTGQTKLSIGVKVSIRGSRVSLIVGPRSGFGVYIDPGRRKEAQTRNARGQFQNKLGDASGITRESRDKTIRASQKVTLRRSRYHNPTRIFHIYERGSAKMSGRHPLEIALNRNKSRFPGIIKSHVDRAISSYGSNVNK